MWHRQQDRAGKHSHLSTPRFCPIRHRESESASNRQGGQSTERSRAASGGRRGDINAFLIRENRVVRLHSNLLVALRGGTGYHRFHFRSLIRLMKHEEKSAQSFLKGKKRRKPKQINPNTMLGQRSCLQIKSDAGWRENSNQIKPSQCWNGCV